MEKYNIILASKSPRRQQLLKDLGVNFSVETLDVEESFPQGMKMEEIPVFLAEKKAEPFNGKLQELDLVITADTIVWHKGQVLGKPEDREHAVEILKSLSGEEHQVVTGV